MHLHYEAYFPLHTREHTGNTGSVFHGLNKVFFPEILIKMHSLLRHLLSEDEIRYQVKLGRPI